MRSSCTRSIDEVWQALNDPAVLVRTIPGCERLEVTGPDRYRIVVSAGVASIKGTYAGEVALHRPADADILRAAARPGRVGPARCSTDVAVTLTDAGGRLATRLTLRRRRRRRRRDRGRRAAHAHRRREEDGRRVLRGRRRRADRREPGGRRAPSARRRAAEPGVLVAPRPRSAVGARPAVSCRRRRRGGDRACRRDRRRASLGRRR